MISNNDFQVIAELDLDPIKVKLMHKESGEGWTLEYANAMEFEYRRFLYLMKKFPNVPATPLFDVDIFWHYHILDTMKYAADCDNVFGYFLHHFPYVGLRGEDDEETHRGGGIRMQQIYEGTFGQPLVRADSGTAIESAASGQSAYSWAVGKDAANAAPKSAYSWAVSKEAVASSNRTAYSWAVGKDAADSGHKSVPSSSRTAYSWAVGKEAATVAKNTAYSWAIAKDVASQAFAPRSPAADFGPLDAAALQHLYFERPSLATT